MIPASASPIRITESRNRETSNPPPLPLPPLQPAFRSFQSGITRVSALQNPGEWLRCVRCTSSCATTYSNAVTGACTSRQCTPTAYSGKPQPTALTAAANRADRATCSGQPRKCLEQGRLPTRAPTTIRV